MGDQMRRSGMAKVSLGSLSGQRSAERAATLLTILCVALVSCSPRNVVSRGDGKTVRMPSTLARQYRDGIKERDSNNLSGAVKIFEHLLAQEAALRSPDNDLRLNTFVQLANCYSRLGEYDKSIRTYVEARAMNPDHLDLLIGLADAYEKKRMYQEALNIFNQAIVLYPHNWKVLEDRGSLYKALGDYAHASQDLLRALESHPNHDRAYVALATVYGDDLSPLRNIEKALSYSERAIELNPSLQNRLLHLSISCRDARAKPATIVEEVTKIEETVGTQSGKQYEHLLIGLIYARFGDTKKAIPHLHQALPDYAHYMKDNPELGMILSPEVSDLQNEIDRVLSR